MGLVHAADTIDNHTSQSPKEAVYPHAHILPYRLTLTSWSKAGEHALLLGVLGFVEHHSDAEFEMGSPAWGKLFKHVKFARARILPALSMQLSLSRVIVRLLANPLG